MATTNDHGFMWVARDNGPTGETGYNLSVDEPKAKGRLWFPCDIVINAPKFEKVFPGFRLPPGGGPIKVKLAGVT